MGLFDDSNELAGVYTEFLTEYDPGYDTSLWTTTDSVLIIGTAFNGPVGKAVKIYSPEYAEHMFGHAYDSKTRQEASLITGIQDAWNRGARGIYACRVSGKEIYKDYQFRSDTTLKLRVSGLFPSNANKDLALVFDNSIYDMNFTIYKPSDRACILEQKAGLVDDSNSIITNYIDLAGNSFTLDTELIQAIEVFNKYDYNKVLRLSIVDEDGNDVTFTSEEAKAIKIGDMFPGLYTIGRSYNAESVPCNTEMSVVFGSAPYESWEGNFYKELSVNTDVSKDLPLYSNNGDLNLLLGISSETEYEFLETANLIDSYFEKDKVDYEEVDLTPFDLYKRLGKGYAINSKLEIVTKETPTGVKTRARVKEVLDEKTRRVALNDGIYSALQNVVCDYRVLNCANADTKIKGTLPKPDEFKCAQINTLKMFNDAISIKAKVSKSDLTAPKKYTFTFEQKDDMSNLNINSSDIYSTRTAREATLLTKAELDEAIENKTKYTNGSIFLVTDAVLEDAADPLTLLYIYTNSEFRCLHKFLSSTEVDGMKNSLIIANGKLYDCTNEVASVANANMKLTSFVEATSASLDSKEKGLVALDNNTYQTFSLASDTSGDLVLTKLGFVDDVLSSDVDKLVISMETSYSDNNIKITSNAFDFLTIDEVVETLNEDKNFNSKFEVEVLDVLKAQECITDLIDEGVSNTGTLIDKTIGYDETKLIPFRTDDNFARQLAQHVAETVYEVGATHGIIGLNILRNTSADAIKEHVDTLVKADLINELVGRKPNGAKMLQKGYPIPIGKNISVVNMQYQLTMDSDNYTTMSNGAAGYAGMVACLPLDQSSTCQAISIPDVTYELTNTELKSLTDAGYVTVKDSYTKGWVITDGITMALPQSEYKRLSASRISNEVGERIREACEPFIGAQNTLANQNALSTAINSTLTEIKGTLIEDFSFQLILDKDLIKLGEIVIEFAVVPIYEIKQIFNRITVSQ